MAGSYYVTLGSAKIAPFKYDDKQTPYGGFINTTAAGTYPVKQDITINNIPLSFSWPSSEHAFHAQKIIHLMRKNPGNPQMQQVLLNALRTIEMTQTGPGQEFKPREHWDSIVTNLTTNYPHLFGPDKKSFDQLCDANYHSKHNPNAGLMPNGEPYTLQFMRDVLKLKLEQNPALRELAKNCARDGILPIEVSQYDDNWASGPNGEGTNMLGIAILELGNEYLKNLDFGLQ